MPNETSRMDYDGFRRSHPDAHAALLALGASVDDGGIEKQLTELVKLRVSQMNGCAFCLQLHLNIARKLGVEEAKLGLVSAWRDAGIFSRREAAALSWAEALTALQGAAAPDAAWARLCEVFDEKDAALLTLTIATINSWNRIAIALRFAPPLPRNEAA